ncbi:hypothetical protein [Streptomyces mayteni]
MDETAHILIVTGLEGPVNSLAPVTCGYCDREIVSDNDHATNCCWRPGTAAAR